MPVELAWTVTFIVVAVVGYVLFVADMRVNPTEHKLNLHSKAKLAYLFSLAVALLVGVVGTIVSLLALVWGLVQ